METQNHMSSDAQIAANIENARHSTGPRTEEGKARSSQNALKHGLTSNKSLLLPDEDEEEFRRFEAGLKHTYMPLDALEADLVDDIISIQWRRKRAAFLEARILSAENPDFKALNNISLIASRLKREFSATHKELMQLQVEREKNLDKTFEAAATIRRADLILNRPTDLATNGFVFSTAQIDEYIRRKDALENARRTVAQAETLRPAA
jgi:hypothetical protein